MRKSLWGLGVLWLLVSCGSGTRQERLLIVGGNDEVNIIDLKTSVDTIPDVIWTWRATEAKDLPDQYRERLFNHVDECKPIDGGLRILVTSSDGGVAIVDRSTKAVLFYTFVGNAHSAAWLPGERVAVAGSTHEKGNRLSIFDLSRGETPLFSDSLYSGHGVVWDDKRRRVYALGYDELRAYELVDWETTQPGLRLSKSWQIKGIGGHDLVQDPTDPDVLILTEHDGAWRFNLMSESFEPFHPLSTTHNVKSVTIHQAGEMAYIKAETSWWSTRIYLPGSGRFLTLPGRRLYKVRWLQ